MGQFKEKVLLKKYNNNKSKEVIDYNSNEKERWKQTLTFFGTDIDFESDTWTCDKKQKSEVHKIDTIIYFTGLPNEFKDLAKYYALVKLNEDLSPRAINNKVGGVKHLLLFIEENKMSLYTLNKSIEIPFYEWLEKRDLSFEFKTQIWNTLCEFLRFVSNWTQETIQYTLFNKNPYKVGVKVKHDYKYIPDEVIFKLDKVFKNENIPLGTRLFYWIARSIPSRPTEVLGMDLECLKPYGENTYVIIIPTWKQNGGYKQAQLRRVYLNYEGHGKFIIDLIKEQQAYVKSIQHKLPEEMKQYLFSQEIRNFLSHHFKKTGEIKYSTYQNNFVLPNRNVMRVRLNQICKQFKVTDANGNIYHLTGHQLRHNGITDRIYAGFSPIQIQLMTEHQSDSMIIKAYTHRNSDILLEKQRLIHSETKNDVEAPVLFRGKILNMDEKLEKRLLANKRAYKIKDIGICSDVTNCSKGIFACLDCDSFVPDAEKLDYFKEQVEYFEQRTIIFKNNKQLKENAEYNLELFKRIVDRIEKNVNMEVVYG